MTNHPPNLTDKDAEFIKEVIAELRELPSLDFTQYCSKLTRIADNIVTAGNEEAGAVLRVMAFVIEALERAERDLHESFEQISESVLTQTQAAADARSGSLASDLSDTTNLFSRKRTTKENTN